MVGCGCWMKKQGLIPFSGLSPLVAGFYAFKMDVYLTIVDVDYERKAGSKIRFSTWARRRPPLRN